MYIKVSGLYIGQGMANLVEVYEKKADAEASPPQIKGLVLLDCGTCGKAGKSGGVNEPQSPVAVDYISQMITHHRGKLDALVLSHMDADHINQIIKLTGKNKDGVLQWIGTVLIGGTTKIFHPEKNAFTGMRSAPGLTWAARNMADAVRKISEKVSIFSVRNGYVQKECDFLKFKSTTPGISDEMRFRVVANRSLPSLNADEDMFINGNSAVIAAEYIWGDSHFAFLFPGDATVDTYTYMNKWLSAHRDKYTFLNASKRVLMLPHHGAVRTSCKNGKISNQETLNEQLGEAKAFADVINATHVYASAHYNAKQYYHPNMQIMDMFAVHAEEAALHENFGFRVRLDSEGKPEGNQKVSYGLFTEAYSTEAYTAHVLKTKPGEIAFSEKLASYRQYNDDVFLITDLPGKEHKFYSLVCSVDNGKFERFIKEH